MAIDTAGIAAAAAAQGGVEQADPAIVAALARIEANKTLPNPQQTPQEAVAAVVEAQKATSTAPATVNSEVVVGGPIANSAGPVKQTSLDDGSDPYVSNGQSTIAPAETPQKQKEVPVSTQTFDDGSKLETFADGATVTTDSEGAVSFRSGPANTETPNQSRSVATSVNAARASQAAIVSQNRIQKEDWRIRLSLAPGANYLYKSATQDNILYPLKDTDGIVFPYNPTIQTAYKASYANMDLIHSNYKMYFYQNSSIDEITLTADFTAQDTTEANYLLAVIHFFKSVTKMFYGQDGNNGPKAGTPPPLCYLNGYGQYQFNHHPVLVSSFTYNLPNDVDYIRAGVPTVPAGTNTNSFKARDNTSTGKNLLSQLRTMANNLTKKKSKSNISADPKWTNYANGQATYVPTKMQIQLSLIPIVTRNDISKNFSLEKYATGSLLKGNQRAKGGGIW